MCPAIDNPAAKFTVIRFLHAKNMSAVEIHCELCVIYSQTVMGEQTVRHWCRMFTDRQWAKMFTMKSEVVSHLY
jgi:hypothetical protein